jgi:hypothetical protein
MARAIRTLSAGRSQGYGQVVQAPSAEHPEGPMQPEGQLIEPHWPVVQVDLHEHESVQSTSPQALVPVQATEHAASLHCTSSQALVPAHVTWHVALPLPQSIAPHAFVAVQLITHDRASEQSMSLQDPFEAQLIVQSKPDGQSTLPQFLPCWQTTLQVRAVRLQPPLQSDGQFSTTQ